MSDSLALMVSLLYSGFRLRCPLCSKDTLLLLLKSLPMGCYFNIYSFGSSHKCIFP